MESDVKRLPIIALTAFLFACGSETQTSTSNSPSDAAETSQTDTAAILAEKQAMAKKEAMAKEMAAKELAAKEAATEEAARLEALRQEASRQETARQEALRQEAARQEAAQQENQKLEGQRLEAQRLETERHEAAILEEERQAAAATAYRVLSSGTWSKKSFAVSGNWAMSSENGVTTVALDSGFSTRSAPDLKIFLSPLSPGQLTGRNATQGSLLVSPLKSVSYTHLTLPTKA